MSNVDWDSKLVIGSKARAPKVTRGNSEVNGAVVATDKKTTVTNKGHVGPDHQKIAKLDRDNEVAPPTKVGLSVGQAIQDARKELKLTQKQVAVMINEKPTVPQSYEAGTAVPSPQILSKLERVLKVKLRGSDIGKKLEGPKKST